MTSMTRRRLLDYLTRAALVGMAIFCGAARGGESDRTQAAPLGTLFKRFDRNGDGKIDDEERQAVRGFMRQRGQQKWFDEAIR